MASAISFGESNSGLQAGIVNGNITTQFLQSETSLNQACLRDLRITSPHDDKDRIEKTNGGLLKDSYCWILDNEQFKQWQDNQSSCLLWIRGDPGKGKTMLVCGIIDEVTRSMGDNTNISFFFCQATDVRINNATAILRGLIYSLVKTQSSLLCHVRSRYDQAGKILFEDINAWNALSRIFTNILRDPALQNTYLAIDALDECTTDLSLLLDLVVQESSTHSHVKWIVSSRNWPNIEERLVTVTKTVPISLELNEASVSKAVRKFIRHKVHQLAKVKHYSAEICDKVYDYLLSNSQGTFLWVALVCQELNRTSRRHVLRKLREFPPGLDSVYGRMIDQVRESEDAELCRRVLAVMSIGYRPIALDELTALVEIPDDLSEDYEALLEIIATCGSFLTLRDNTIIFVHQSAKEFLLGKARVEVFPGDKGAEHRAIFSRSLHTLSKMLRRNIFDIDLEQTSTEILRERSPNPLAAAEYACVHWVDHLREGWCVEDKDPSVEGFVDCFMRQKYLHWLEALGILGNLSEGIKAMLKLERLLLERGGPHALLDRVKDASRFIRYYRQAIESNPLQIYSSGLVFSPIRSITKGCYEKERPKWILNSPLVDEDWSSCLQTLEGHSDLVNSIVWSPDGSRLASASDKTVRIWDPATGQCTSTLRGHIGSVTSITWSPDTTRLASASGDLTVRIWDPATGQSALIMEGHSKTVTSISWSPAGIRLASTSDDRTINIWDPATGQHVLTLDGQSDLGVSISWSPDGSRLASASKETVRIWDLATGQCTSTLKGHNESVRSIAWSPDGSRFASASRDKTLKVWDPAAGQCVSTLKGHSKSVKSIAWSPDGSQLASASEDKTARIWDPDTGQCRFALERGNDWAQLIAWSPYRNRLASTSFGNTLRIWNPTTGQCTSILEGHIDWVHSITWSPDGSRLASASFDKTVRIWDPATVEGESILEAHSKSITSIAWSPDGIRLASTSDDGGIRIWDPATGKGMPTLARHGKSVTSIAWSSDGLRLASASYDETIMIWEPATGRCASILDAQSEVVRLIVWSPDGSRLATPSGDKTIRIWDPAAGQCASALKGHTELVTSIAWSSDGSRIATTSGDKTIRIWNPMTGKCESTLDGHTEFAASIAWSPDGSQLASATYQKTVRIWNLASSQCAFILDIDTPYFLQFDKNTPSQLHTNMGTINLGSTEPVVSCPHHLALPGAYGYGLSDDSSWITLNGLNLLWLPAEYRPSNPSLFAIYSTTIAIGCSSGRVIFLALSEHNLLSRV